MRASAKNTKRIFACVFPNPRVNPLNSSAASSRLLLSARASRRESHYPVISTFQKWCVPPNQFRPGALHCATSVRRQPQSLLIRVQAPLAIHKPNISHVHSVVAIRSCLTIHSTGPIAVGRLATTLGVINSSATAIGEFANRSEIPHAKTISLGKRLIDEAGKSFNQQRVSAET